MSGPPVSSTTNGQPDAFDQDGTHSNAGGTAPSSFFRQERERLIADIAESIGEIMTNTNALNRKLEESVLVGREFEPVAQLWARFAAMMGGPITGATTEDGGQAQQQQQPHQADKQAPTQASASSSVGLQQSQSHSQSATTPGRLQHQQPMEVAPGGGSWATAADIGYR